MVRLASRCHPSMAAISNPRNSIVFYSVYYVGTSDSYQSIYRMILGSHLLAVSSLPSLKLQWNRARVPLLLFEDLFLPSIHCIPFFFLSLSNSMLRQFLQSSWRCINGGIDISNNVTSISPSPQPAH